MIEKQEQVNIKFAAACLPVRTFASSFSILFVGATECPSNLPPNSTAVERPIVNSTT
jgi:hypothetical protein